MVAESTLPLATSIGELEETKLNLSEPFKPDPALENYFGWRRIEHGLSGKCNVCGKKGPKNFGGSATTAARAQSHQRANERGEFSRLYKLKIVYT